MNVKQLTIGSFGRVNLCSI